jgi:hypothetical protein
MPAGRPKGHGNKITDEQRMWAARVDKMLAQASPDKKDGFDRLICRLLTSGAEATKVALIRLMIPYRRGLPKQEIEANLTVSYTEALQKMRAKRAE